jgi:hypothetical protein
VIGVEKYLRVGDPQIPYNTNEFQLGDKYDGVLFWLHEIGHGVYGTDHPDSPTNANCQDIGQYSYMRSYYEARPPAHRTVKNYDAEVAQHMVGPRSQYGAIYKTYYAALNTWLTPAIPARLGNTFPLFRMGSMSEDVQDRNMAWVYSTSAVAATGGGGSVRTARYSPQPAWTYPVSNGLRRPVAVASKPGTTELMLVYQQTSATDAYGNLSDVYYLCYSRSTDSGTSWSVATCPSNSTRRYGLTATYDPASDAFLIGYIADSYLGALNEVSDYTHQYSPPYTDHPSQYDYPYVAILVIPANGSPTPQQTTLTTGWSYEAPSIACSNATITRDSTSGWYTPASAAEWATLLQGTGIAAPSHIWQLQESSGQLADSVGSATLTNASMSYRTNVSGWSRKAMSSLDINGAYYLYNNTDTGLPDGSTTSLTVLSLLSITGHPTGDRGVLYAGGNGHRAIVTANGYPKVSTAVGGNSAVGTHDVGTSVRPWILRSNVTSATLKLDTDFETVTPTWAAASSGKAVFLGAAIENAPGMNLLYAVEWQGSSAELTDSQVAMLIDRIKNGPGTLGCRIVYDDYDTGQLMWFTARVVGSSGTVNLGPLYLQGYTQFDTPSVAYDAADDTFRLGSTSNNNAIYSYSMASSANSWTGTGDIYNNVNSYVSAAVMSMRNFSQGRRLYAWFPRFL